MLPPLCIWVLPQGRPCTQFALRGRLLCRAHEKSARIEQTDLQNQSICARIATLDLLGLIDCLQETLSLAGRHRMSPDRQRLVYTTVHHRLTQIFLENLPLPPSVAPPGSKSAVSAR